MLDMLRKVGVSTMSAVIYVCGKDVSIYTQFNQCANYAKKHGYSIAGKVLDFESNSLYEAINKVVADENIDILLVYSKEIVFPKHDDYLFYRIYLEKLGKKLVFCV